MRQRSKLHWRNVACHPWAIVVYNVEPTLDQRRNAIWGLDGDVHVGMSNSVLSIAMLMRSALLCGDYSSTLLTVAYE